MKLGLQLFRRHVELLRNMEQNRLGSSEHGTLVAICCAISAIGNSIYLRFLYFLVLTFMITFWLLVQREVTVRLTHHVG